MWMLTKANGYAFDEQLTRFDAILIEGQTIVAVGHEADLRLQFGTKVDRVVSVDGATVIPGLVDNHLHIAGVGDKATQLDLTGIRTKREILEKTRAWVQHHTEHEWILGGGWDDNRILDGDMPTLAELDEATNGRPLVLSRVCTHVALVNSQTLKLAQIGHDVRDMDGGKFGRDASGRLNGLLYENAISSVHRVIPSHTEAQWANIMRAGMRAALETGITAVHTDDVRHLGSFGRTWSLMHQMVKEEGIRLRMHELVGWDYLDECLEALPGLPQPDEWIELGAAKLFSDGSMGGRTAWLKAPYADAPDWYGTPMHSPEELARRIRVAHEKGFAVAVHAIGDAGLEATLAGIEAAPQIESRDRIVHAELVNPDLISRMAALGERLAIDIQPRFTCSDFPWVVDRVGSERAHFVCAWKTLKQAGLHLGGGSDAPVEPIAPLLGIHAAVTRRLPDALGEGFFMEEALTPVEAIQLFTRDACFANGLENRKGQIRAGWMADFTIVDRDIVHPVHVDDIRDARAVGTIVGGHIAYGDL